MKIFKIIRGGHVSLSQNQAKTPKTGKVGEEAAFLPWNKKWLGDIMQHPDTQFEKIWKLHLPEGTLVKGKAHLKKFTPRK